MNERPLGFIIEPESFGTARGAIFFDEDVHPGSYVRVKCAARPDILAIVRGVRSAGGVFTAESAAYHLEHLDEVQGRISSTFQILDLSFVATVERGRVLDRRPRPLPGGATILRVQTNELSSFLQLEKGGLSLGEHASHPGLQVALGTDDLRRAHTAIVGQTGSGKTNVLQLLHAGLHKVIGLDSSYVLFDFHDEFEPIDGIEATLSPPFSFGSGDLMLDVLLELLPGLSIPQQDILAIALDHNPKSLGALGEVLARAEGNESSKRVVVRRLSRLERAGAFSEGADLGARVAQLAARPGTGTILRLGAVQSELAHVFISSVVRRLMTERMSGRIPPVLLLVDEAHRLMASQSSPTATRSFRFVAQEGRKFAITMVLATQRPALIDPTILSQCGTMLALRLTSPDDARAVTQVMSEIRPSDLGSLGLGQGLLSRAWSTDILWVNFSLHKGLGQKSQRPKEHKRAIQQSLFDL